MNAPALPDPLARVLREHAATIDPWLRRAADVGVGVSQVREALAEAAPALVALDGAEPRAEVALPVVRTVLDLLARGRWQAGAVQRTTVLRDLPLLAAWVRAWPDDTVPAVVAAAGVVARAHALPGWVARLAAAPAPDEAAFVRPALIVAAWRSGLVRYRSAALDAADTLPAGLAAALLGLAAGEVGAALARHRADRWWWPGFGDAPGVVLRAGGFVAWGGPWRTRPTVLVGGPTGWGVRADDAAWAVVADVHGTAVLPLPDETGLVAPAPARVTLPVPWRDQVTGVAQAPDAPVALVSRAHSYALDVVRLAPEPR